MLVNLCEKGDFNRYFFKHGTNITTFQELYCTVFTLFADFYQKENPVDIMAFNSILMKFRGIVVDVVEQHYRY